MKNVLLFSKKYLVILIVLFMFVLQSSFNDLKNTPPTTLPFAQSEQTGLPLCVGGYFKMKPIPQYPDYLISDDGEKIYKISSKKFIKIQLRSKLGYKGVTLVKDKKKKMESVHRLVAFTYLDNPNNYPIVNHIDNNPSNNSASNLEWCTYSHNSLHKYKSGYVNSEKQRASARKTMLEYRSKKLRYKKIIDTKTGEIFESITQAAISIGMDKRDLCRRLRGHAKNKTNFKYYEI